MLDGVRLLALEQAEAVRQRAEDGKVGSQDVR